jgi:hypothetical protein
MFHKWSFEQHQRRGADPASESRMFGNGHTLSESPDRAMSCQYPRVSQPANLETGTGPLQKQGLRRPVWLSH